MTIHCSDIYFFTHISYIYAYMYFLYPTNVYRYTDHFKKFNITPDAATNSLAHEYLCTLCCFLRVNPRISF